MYILQLKEIFFFINIDAEFYAEDFSDIDGKKLDNQTEYSFIIKFYLTVYGNYDYSPAVMYLPNGDPDYHAEEDWDPQQRLDIGY